jgi:hypothetical protein
MKLFNPTSSLPWLLPAVWLGCLVGCQSASPSGNGPASSAAEGDPTVILAEQWEKGSYQVEAATTVLADLKDDLATAAKSAKGETKESLLDVADAVESVGQQIAEFAEAATEQEIKQDFSKADEDRLRAIKTLNESTVETREAMDLANQLEPELADAIGANLDEAAKAQEAAILAFGGAIKVPE